MRAEAGPDTLAALVADGRRMGRFWPSPDATATGAAEPFTEAHALAAAGSAPPAPRPGRGFRLPARSAALLGRGWTARTERPSHTPCTTRAPGAVEPNPHPPRPTVVHPGTAPGGGTVEIHSSKQRGSTTRRLGTLAAIVAVTVAGAAGAPRPRRRPSRPPA
ncbi:hypothetical protein GXW82_23095 [Streptacidiphilus sp. 4-A2]|nr:hypothetical protein [Streptacidiphilus sp. 4-A2]